MSGARHEAEAGGIAADRLRSAVERIERDHLVTVADLIAELVAEECWATVPGYTSYLVSSWGRIRRRETGLVLQPIEGHGYQHVDLSKEGVVRRHRVNRLVALTFLGPEPFPGAIAAHNDGRRANNRLDNIRWATGTDNQRDRERHGTRIRGSEVFGAKLADEAIPAIRRAIAAGERYPLIAARHGVSISTISLIKRGRIWRHVQ